MKESYKEGYKMTQMERIEHRKKIEKWSKDNVQELLKGNDWLKSGDYTPSRKLQENVSYFELECMSLSAVSYTHLTLPTRS